MGPTPFDWPAIRAAFRAAIAAAETGVRMDSGWVVAVGPEAGAVAAGELQAYPDGRRQPSRPDAGSWEPGWTVDFDRHHREAPCGSC